MELSQLNAFYQVAQTGSFSKAADHLFISQPALSRQVASLENDLELQLFSRLGRKVVLTDAGRRLLVYAEKIISLYGEARKEMHELKDLETGELTLGASTTIGNYLLPSILAGFQKRNPGIKINLHIGNSSQVEHWLLENKIEIGLIAGTHHLPGLYQEMLAKDELYLVIPPTHPFASAITISSEQLSQETFLFREEGSDTQASFEVFLRNHKIQSPTTMVLGDTEGIKRGVISGMGLAFLSKFTIEYELKLGLLKTIKIPEFIFDRPLTCIYLKDLRLSPAALSFMAQLRKMIGLF